MPGQLLAIVHTSARLPQPQKLAHFELLSVNVTRTECHVEWPDAVAKALGDRVLKVLNDGAAGSG